VAFGTFWYLPFASGWLTTLIDTYVTCNSTNNTCYTLAFGSFWYLPWADGKTTGHLEVDTPRATVPSLSTCDRHMTGHWPVALFKRRDRRRDTFNCPLRTGEELWMAWLYRLSQFNNTLFYNWHH